MRALAAPCGYQFCWWCKPNLNLIVSVSAFTRRSCRSFNRSPSGTPRPRVGMFGVDAGSRGIIADSDGCKYRPFVRCCSCCAWLDRHGGWTRYQCQSRTGAGALHLLSFHRRKSRPARVAGAGAVRNCTALAASSRSTL